MDELAQKKLHGKFYVPLQTFFLLERCNFEGQFTRLQPFPIFQEFILVQDDPGFHQALFSFGERTLDQLNLVSTINANSVLVVRVQMRMGVRCA